MGRAERLGGRTSKVLEVVGDENVQGRRRREAEGEGAGAVDGDGPIGHDALDTGVGRVDDRAKHQAALGGDDALASLVSAAHARGIRVIGERHRVLNNHLEGLRGDEERSAITFMLGIPDSSAHGYFQVKDAVIEGNSAIVTWPVDVWFDGQRTFEAELDFGGRRIFFRFRGWHLAKIELVDDGLDFDQAIGLDDRQREVVEATLALLLFGAVTFAAIRAEEGADRRRGGLLSAERRKEGHERAPKDPAKHALSGGTNGRPDHVKRDPIRGECRC